MNDEERCNHDRKVYSGEYFACYPPKWHWACEDCGEVGATAPLRGAPSTPDWRRFCDAMAKRDPRGAAVLRDTYARAEERRKAGDGMGSFRMIQKGATVTINAAALPWRRVVIHGCGQERP